MRKEAAEAAKMRGALLRSCFTPPPPPRPPLCRLLAASAPAPRACCDGAGNAPTHSPRCRLAAAPQAPTQLSRRPPPPPFLPLFAGREGGFDVLKDKMRAAGMSEAAMGENIEERREVKAASGAYPPPPHAPHLPPPARPPPAPRRLCARTTRML